MDAAFSRIVFSIFSRIPSTQRCLSFGLIVSILLTIKIRRLRSLVIILFLTKFASLIPKGLPGTTTMIIASSIGITLSDILSILSSSFNPGVSMISTPS